MTGDPVRVSVCHCLNCKKRSGSAFAVQARWPPSRSTSRGGRRTFEKVADSGNRATFHFCPDCGSDVHYEIDGKFDGLVAIPSGAFDDPYFAHPAFSVWEERKHDWVEILGERSSTRIESSVLQPPEMCIITQCAFAATRVNALAFDGSTSARAWCAHARRLRTFANIRGWDGD